MGGIVRAGFVTTGGSSSRMGRDKAVLPLNGLTLVEQIASCVRSAAGNVGALSPARIEPPCAVYHRRRLGPAEQAIHHKMFKMQDFVSGLHYETFPVPDPSLLRNVDTPEEWSAR